jgi:hypothetical protein
MAQANLFDALPHDVGGVGAAVSDATVSNAAASDRHPLRPWQPVTALAFSATFGLALGARFGALSMAVHAAAVPLGFVAVTLLAVPAFCIGMAHAGVELDVSAVTRSVASALMSAGRALVGLAPAMLLLAVTCESAKSVTLFGVLGLAVGSALGMRALFIGLESLENWNRPTAKLLRWAFASFTALFGARIWWALLPMFGGGS